MVRRRAVALGVVAGAFGSVSCLQARPPMHSSDRRLAPAPQSAINRPAPAAAADDGIPHRAVLQKYCTSCHSERLRTAGLALTPALLERPGDHSEAWEKIVVKLRAGAMPPPGAPRPDAPTVGNL